MPETVDLSPAAKSRDRSIAGRRRARALKADRERLIVDCLNRGLSVAEISARTGVTEKRMRAAIREIVARRQPEAPAEFVAIQVSRLNEALNVAYSAMSPENLAAVRLVVRIVRELDRYHGFAAPTRRPARGNDARQDGERVLSGTSPRMAAQASEKTRFAPGNRRVEAPLEPPAPFHPTEGGLSADASEPHAAGAGAPMAPQAIEKAQSAPENGSPPTARETADSRPGSSVAVEAPEPARDNCAPRRTGAENSSVVWASR
jgi:hypothetical protein